MDPDSCLILIHQYLKELRNGCEESREEAVEALRNLARWLSRGGSAPESTWYRKE